MLKGINWIAVAIAVVFVQLFGVLWYGMIFSSAWMAEMKALGIAIDVSNAAILESVAYGIVVTLVMVVGLAWLVGRLGETTLQGGLMTAFWLALFFGLTIRASEFVYMNFSTQLVAINAGHHLLAFLIAGAVLGGVKIGAPRAAAAA